MLLVRILGLGALLSVSGSAIAQISVGPGDNVEQILNGLSPGDEVVLDGGLYTLNERFTLTAVGSPNDPIIIRSASGQTAHFRRPNAAENIWDVVNAEFVVLQGLEFSGGSAGLRIQAARNLTVEDCEIHDTADVALRMNDEGVTYENIRILRNHIHDTDNTGEGMYLGCNMNMCRLANSEIGYNYVHDMNGPDISQGDGIELKEGSFGNVIHDNVVHDTNYPCIIGYSTVGNGPANVVERNVMWNCGDNGIQWSADAIIRNNIVLSAAGSGIATQPHQSGAPSNMEIVHNTVVIPGGAALRVGDAVGAVLIANNALYTSSGSALRVVGDASELTVLGNVGVGGANGIGGSGLTPGNLAADFVAANYGGAPPNNVFPAAGGGLVASADATSVALDDFNRTPRNGAADVGAYLFGAAGNPGWTISPEFKPDNAGPPPPRMDAGATDAESPETGPHDTGGRDGGVVDTGGPPVDSGSFVPDAMVAFVDSGPSPREPESEPSDGCSCAGHERPRRGPASLLLTLGVLALLVGSRKRIRL